MSILSFSIDFTNGQLTGIAQARTAYNLSKNTQLSDVQYLSEIILKASDSYATQYSAIAPVAPSSIALVADWVGLYNRLLGGTLSDIFNRVNLAAIANPSITIGLLNMNGALTNVRVESALASALQILKLSGYVFTPQEIGLWNTAIAELNFSNLVKL